VNSGPINSGLPAGPTAVPDVVTAIAGNASVIPVWRNDLGGLTFRLERKGDDVRYVKWVASGTPEIDLAGEAMRLAWAQSWARVPPVLDQGSDTDGAWLVTASVPGQSAIAPRWKAQPTIAAEAIGRGLRLLHESLPVDECPFDWSIERRLIRADERIAGGEGPAQWSSEHKHLGLTEARTRLGDPPPIDRLVVCHGDACTPNSLLYDDGSFAAHVDLGSLGVADRWADLAVATWSLGWDYGPGFDGILLDGYGIEPDPQRITYYRLLYDLA